MLHSIARSAAPVLREGAIEGIQAFATAVVVYGGIAIAGLGAYGAYHAGRVTARAAHQATSATVNRVRDTFRRGPSVPGAAIHQVANVETIDI